MTLRLSITSRFVILCHDDPCGRHFDFMLERGDVLQTWALREPPRLGLEIEARPLVDHRLAYLDYEGPISGGRGSVTRWDTGTFSTIRQNDIEWTLDLAGTQFRGRLTIQCEKIGRTVFHF